MMFCLNYLSDYEISNQCTNHCLSERSDCIAPCLNNSTCLYECDVAFGACFNSCPCQIWCPEGCHNCDSPFCKCSEPDNNDEYRQCEERIKFDQLKLKF